MEEFILIFINRGLMLLNYSHLTNLYLITVLQSNKENGLNNES